MKLKDLYIVPMIGFGFFDQEIAVTETDQKFKIRHVFILFFKATLYREIQ
tara:strand:- start:437 stop:586 length:150 start_codon:yes stop_codon:yes gene_type:complete